MEIYQVIVTVLNALKLYALDSEELEQVISTPETENDGFPLLQRVKINNNQVKLLSQACAWPSFIIMNLMFSYTELHYTELLKVYKFSNINI